MLTNGTDVATANVFNAGLVYNPAGTDRINALQSEDTLTGVGDNPTLNATLGNANDNGATTVTPKLFGIETINLEITGDTNTLDLRNADATQAISINRITAEAGNTVSIDNIGTPASELAVRNTSKVLVDVDFVYTDGVLAGTRAGGNAESGQVALANANLGTLHIGNQGSGTDTEGFENLAVNASGGVVVQNLEAIDLENLTITGSGSLTVAKLTPTNENTVLDKNGGITIGDGIGVRKIDASAYTGNLTLDISDIVGKHVDPSDSGNPFYAEILGGEGDDTFWSDTALTGDNAKLGDRLDGGAGNNRLILTDGDITARASIQNIQQLELRNQVVNTDTHNIDLKAFDSALKTVLIRDEDPDGSSIAVNLDNAPSSLFAADGGLILRHSVSEGTVLPSNATVQVRLADASGTKDTVAIRVENDLNEETQFNYTLNFDGGPAGAGAIENVTILDADTESNEVYLSANTEHTGTITLSGGKAGQFYTVKDQLYAAEIDAAAQASDLRLSVGNQTDKVTALNQTIKLGTGNDILTFVDLNSLDGNDVITDAGGDDTVRAAFSKSPTGVINLTGVERFHIVATDNVTLDLSKAATVTELAILSDQAVDGGTDKSPILPEPFNLTGVATTDIITLQNTALSRINFFGDNDINDDAATESGTHQFNGVTLANNSVSTLEVAINSSIDPAEGATSYAVGQLTAHGVKDMTITVGNEKTGGAATSIANIYAKDLSTLRASAQGSLDLGVVSGNVLGNNLTLVDVSAVKGNFTADVVALGNNAVVNLAQGENTFSALGSGGNNVTINGNSRSDTITGTAQNDIINAGAGDDTVHGDRGDNTLNLGAGDDTVTARDGNNIVAFGTGTAEVATINDNTGLDGSKATNVFTLEGTAARVEIDSDGAGPFEVQQMLAVGDGSALRVSWTGSTLNVANALLDGGKGIVPTAATYNGDANANLVVDEVGGTDVNTFNGGAGNDVFIQFGGVAAAVTFNGGAGNDAFVGDGTKAHTVTGGAGADRIVLANDGSTDSAGSTVAIADGDSTAAGWDQVYGFGAAKTTLDLVFTTYAGNTVPPVDGTNVGNVKSHSITNGVVTFDDADTFTAAVNVGTGANQLALADVLQYLAINLNGTGATVAFAYDRNGDGTDDDMFVFQDGMSDTVVQLVGFTTGNAATDILLS